ncbi:hypothetical protein T440DRAFT_553557 [Plenodomus tracheiphilus IPT5]|uniref:RING-type domain-containing protein n=1 Tax=Plenodomus tracheiphilus IPT5 TaxID=1408161 RepID=A0A6A7BB17_9PLEO|nr:hypothetical protein T440DRAFT_553557 [Plenodomus tracheiphilus IPT5]
MSSQRSHTFQRSNSRRNQADEPVLDDRYLTDAELGSESEDVEMSEGDSERPASPAMSPAAPGGSLYGRFPRATIGPLRPVPLRRGSSSGSSKITQENEDVMISVPQTRRGVVDNEEDADYVPSDRPRHDHANATAASSRPRQAGAGIRHFQDESTKSDAMDIDSDSDAESEANSDSSGYPNCVEEDSDEASVGPLDSHNGIDFWERERLPRRNFAPITESEFTRFLAWIGWAPDPGSDPEMIARINYLLAEFARIDLAGRTADPTGNAGEGDSDTNSEVSVGPDLEHENRVLSLQEAEAFVEALPQVDLATIADENMECPLCYTAYDEPSSWNNGHDNTPIRIPCAGGHVLGHDCLSRSVTEHGTRCPFDREDMFSD